MTNPLSMWRGRSLSPVAGHPGNNAGVVGNSGIPFSSKIVQELDGRMRKGSSSGSINATSTATPRVNSGRISNYSHLSATPYRYGVLLYIRIFYYICDSLQSSFSSVLYHIDGSTYMCLGTVRIVHHCEANLSKVFRESERWRVGFF